MMFARVRKTIIRSFLQTGVRSDDWNKDWLDKLCKIRLLRR